MCHSSSLPVSFSLVYLKEISPPKLYSIISLILKNVFISFPLSLQQTRLRFSQPGGNTPAAGFGAPQQFGSFGPAVTVGHNHLPYGSGHGPVPNGAPQWYASNGPLTATSTVIHFMTTLHGYTMVCHHPFN